MLIRSVLLVSALAFLAACQAMKGPTPASPTPAAVSDTPEADRARLLTRVNAYWQARMQRDLKTTSQYELLSHRQRLNEKVYRTRLGNAFPIVGFSIMDSQVPLKATHASISLELKFESYFFGPRPVESIIHITDRWKKDQGVWYHILDTYPPTAKPKKKQASAVR